MCGPGRGGGGDTPIERVQIAGMRQNYVDVVRAGKSEVYTHKLNVYLSDCAKRKCRKHCLLLGAASHLDTTLLIENVMRQLKGIQLA